MNLSKAERLGTALRNGQQLTARQIASRFDAANPHDLVYRLRNSGMTIEQVSRTNSKGQTFNFYTMPQKRSRKTRAA
jgi:hypothetical protein